MFSYFMIRILFSVIVFGGICFGFELGLGSKDNNTLSSNNESENWSSNRTGRGFLPTGGIFTLGKVLNFFPVGGERECKTTKGNTIARSGICLNPYDCRQRDGKASGDCAHGLGVCCVFEVTCGGKVQHNLTYFISPGFPEIWNDQKDCTITIDKAFAGITQLRLDFLHFNIGQPNRTTGECDQDVMTLGDAQPFRICGQNHGQHVYYNLPTSSESREADDLPASTTTKLTIRSKGYTPRLWMMRLAQMPLAYSAPHDCMQYFTDNSGTISTFNYATNGRHLSGQSYKACVRKNPGFCSIRYQPCDERSFRIGIIPGLVNSIDTYVSESGPGSSGGPGTGFIGPDGSFIGPMGPIGPDMDQEVVDTQSDPVIEDGMMPAISMDDPEDNIEGSGDDPANGPIINNAPPPSMASRIWRLIWPSWLWTQNRPKSDRRMWTYNTPYSQHYTNKIDEDFVYHGYGQFGDGLRGYGRLQCQDRITIPCDNEYLLTSSPQVSGVCDPHHCGSSFCPGLRFQDCRVQTSISPFTVTMHFGEPLPKANPEDNIGACLSYSQVPCDN